MCRLMKLAAGALAASMLLGGLNAQAKKQPAEKHFGD